MKKFLTVSTSLLILCAATPAPSAKQLLGPGGTWQHPVVKKKTMVRKKNQKHMGPRQEIKKADENRAKRKMLARLNKG